MYIGTGWIATFFFYLPIEALTSPIGSTYTLSTIFSFQTSTQPQRHTGNTINSGEMASCCMKLSSYKMG